MRTTPTPDIEGMVNRGESRLHRRNTMRIGLAAAAVLLVGGSIYGATQLGGNDDPGAGVATQPSEPAEAAAPPIWGGEGEDVDVAPGTYRTYVGLDETGDAIEADLTIDGDGWSSSNYPVAFDDEQFAGIGAYQADQVAGGCEMGAGLKTAATEPQQLAQQLTRMPLSSVVQQPTPVRAFGHDAFHLRLRVDAACRPFTDGSAYLVAEGGNGGRGISYVDGNPDGVSGVVIIDFWVVDVDGTTVMVDMFHTVEAPESLVEQATRAKDSLTFVEAG